MKWWFRSSVFVLGLFLAACSLQPVPLEERLETAALQAMVTTPTSLNVPADSNTGMFLDLLGIFASTDTFSFSLVSPPAGVSIATPTLVQSIANRFRRFQAVLRVGPNVVLGDHVITFQVTSGTVIRTAALNLTVTQTPANPTFKLTVRPNVLEIPRSSTRSTNVFVTRVKGFNQAITLSLDTSATTLTGVSANPVNLDSVALTGAMTISASATAAPFGLPFVAKVKGTAGNNIKQANLTITVKTPSGSLDPTFDGDGIVPISFSGNRFALALLSNNKIVTAQTVTSATGPINLKRFNANGSVDTNFGTNGQITHTLPVTLHDIWIQTLPDNKVLVVASAFTDNPNDEPGSEQVFILRLRASGQLDTTFSGDGIFNMDMPDESTVEAFTVQSDGKILVGGIDVNTAGGVTVIRLNADGNSLDTSFGASGVVAINSNLNMRALFDIAVQSDGKILLSGRRQTITGISTDAVIGRLLSNGVVDASFAGGFLSMSFNAALDEFNHIALDANQRILAFGQRTINDTKLARVNSNATLDSSFSGDGHLTLHSTFLGNSGDVNEVDLAVQSDNKPLVLVKSGSNTLLVRLTTAGSLDTSFAGGKVTVSSSIGNPVQMALDSDGRIVVLGSSGLARYAP